MNAQNENTRETVVTTSKETREVRDGVVLVKREEKTITVKRGLPEKTGRA